MWPEDLVMFMETLGALISVFVPFVFFLVVLATTRNPHWSSTARTKGGALMERFVWLGFLIIDGFSKAEDAARKDAEFSKAKEVLWEIYSLPIVVALIMTLVVEAFIGWWIGHQAIGLMGLMDIYDTGKWIVATFGNDWSVHALCTAWPLIAMVVCLVVVPVMIFTSLAEVGVRTAKLFARRPTESRA